MNKLTEITTKPAEELLIDDDYEDDGALLVDRHFMDGNVDNVADLFLHGINSAFSKAEDAKSSSLLGDAPSKPRHGGGLLNYSLKD